MLLTQGYCSSLFGCCSDLPALKARFASKELSFYSCIWNSSIVILLPSPFSLCQAGRKLQNRIRITFGFLGNPDRVGPVPEVALEVLLVCVREKERRKIVIPRREGVLYSLQAFSHWEVTLSFLQFLHTVFKDAYMIFGQILGSV